jgi:hypothetical protein
MKQSSLLEPAFLRTLSGPMRQAKAFMAIRFVQFDVVGTQPISKTPARHKHEFSFHY